jgi:hypothetical protein
MIKKSTLSAEATLIEQAKQYACTEGTTQNELFGQWLADYVGQPEAVERYRSLMQRLRYVNAGRKFSRDEMNERR